MPAEPYRAPMPIEPDPYAAAWRDLRRRQRVGKAAVIFSAPLFFLSAGVWLHIQAGIHNAVMCDPTPCLDAALLLRDEADAVWPLLWLPAVIWAIASLYRRNFRCPHCERRFAVRQRECAHCGIAIGTPKSAVVSAGMV